MASKKRDSTIARFACPRCKARRGDKCRTPNGTRLGIPHAPRHRLAFPTTSSPKKSLLQQAWEKAEQLDKDRKLLLGSVLAIHQDGSILLFDSAEAHVWKPEKARPGYVIILTENHGPHVYNLDGLKNLRALGPRESVGTL
jgi:hypothetical protein